MFTMNVVVESLVAAGVAVLVLLACHELGGERPVRRTHERACIHVNYNLYKTFNIVIALRSKAPAQATHTRAA
jgi:hypothetical protein